MNVISVVSAKDLRESYFSNKYANETMHYFKRLLPLKSTVTLAEIVADLMTDGHIAARKYYNAKKYSYIGFFSDDETELIRFNQRINKIFNLNGQIKKWGIRKLGSSTGCIVVNARLARLLELCGVPSWDKTKKRYKIPGWIINGEKRMKQAFIKRSFTCEGSIDRERNGRWEIRYTMYKLQKLSPNTISYLNSIRKILKEFDIKTYNPGINQRYVRKKDGETILGFVLRIRDKKSLINYAKYIGFYTKNKREKLKTMLNQIRM